MAYLYIDPTEARNDTRVPQAVIEMATELPGFESMTGADWLISPLKWPRGVDCANNLPTRARLRKHLHDGAIMVQRKSGGDFVQSIPHLKEHQARMMAWCVGLPGRCWLLVSEVEVSMGKDGPIIHATGNSDHPASYAAAEMALIKWRMRGGNVEIIGGDSFITRWTEWMLKAVDDCHSEPDRAWNAWEPLQRLIREPENWVTTGSAFPPGIGRRKLEALAEELGGSIKDPPPLGLVSRMLTTGGITAAKGWGKVLQKRMREWWGSDHTQSPPTVIEFYKDGSVIIASKQKLPVEFSGDGVERIGERAYLLKDRQSVEAVDMVIAALNERSI